MSHVAKTHAVLPTVKSLLRLNQPDGFDCPGCAWPEPKQTSSFEFCENGMKAVAWETTGKRVDPAFFAEHTVSQLAAQTDHWLEAQGRLTHPMRYDAASDKYLPVSWDEAFALIGDRLNALGHPDEAIFYTSGRTSNEAAFLYQLFGRMVGTNNFPDCSNMCHESSGEALGETIGIGKGTVTLEDFDHADAIFVIGQNPGTNHPRMLTELQKASKRGADIVAINPMKEPGLQGFLHPQQAVAMLRNADTPIASLYVQPLVGGDLALLKGVCKLVLEAEAQRPGEVLDRAFIDEHTAGLEAFLEDLALEDWGTIEAESGVSRETIQQVADVYLKSRRVIVCWAMGLTQHRHAVPTIQMAVNLLLLGGHLGREGAGACPVRGHSNVQGDRTMGITERPKPAFLEALEREFGFTPPTGHGVDVVAAIEAMHAGKGRVFVGMGGNFVSATPDTPNTIAAMRQCDLTVHISTKLNRSHTVTGKDALILPCLGRTEADVKPDGSLQRVTVEDSMSQVHASSGTKAPASGELLSEPAIVAGMARATLNGDGQIDWSSLVADYDRVRDLIARVIPGFEDFNRKIDTPGGFYLGNSARDRQWRTAGNKARFTVAAIPRLGLPEGQLRLMTLRSHDQYNTTVYDLNDRYRGIKGERDIVMMNPYDIEQRGLSAGQRVDLTSHFADGRQRVAKGFKVVALPITPGCAAGYFPELNVLVSVNSFADRSRTPTSKFIPVSLSPSA
ncbi:MAG: FdhF/YdeP family oxidoreductase [Planctomycetota bacterium]